MHLGGAAQWLARGFMCMFYALPPAEIALAPGEAVPDILGGFGIPMFFVLIAIEFVAMRIVWPSVGAYRLNDTLASIAMGIVQQLLGIVLARCGLELGVCGYRYLHDNWRLVDAFDVKGHPWLTWAGLAFGVDLGYYWAHRLLHSFHAGWAAHSVHHSGEYYNLATALRQGALQPLVTWIPSLPLALVFPTESYAVHAQLNTLFQFWIHTEAAGRLGPLEYIFNTPFHHRMHHRPPGNCNYAGVFIIWDRMFGTYQTETRRIDHYGLAKSARTLNPVAINALHWDRMGYIAVPSDSILPAAMYRLFARRTDHPLRFDPRALFRSFAPYESGYTSWSPPTRPWRREKYNGAAAGVEQQSVACLCFAAGLGALLQLLLAPPLALEHAFMLAAASAAALYAMGLLLDSGWIAPAVAGLATAVALAAVALQ
eukprot:TRINITY_DN56248_c0_g1_i1.p1 TRINITY_DN56248_c0_g1~~TRINITY_DN56248_c0_g1_i1.p1  ORF type:complete len:427 (+),score=111.11 TRINITY_DN56248_c0_g1_i1:88-1368(+)